MKHKERYRIRTTLLIMMLLSTILACQNESQNSNNQSSTQTKKEEQTSGKKNTVITKTGKKIEVAEMGFTVVNPNGWTNDQMDFQIRYCESMFESVETMDGTIFCPCFLDKIQYYYEPRFVRDAYSDQKKWNEECTEKASK